MQRISSADFNNNSASAGSTLVLVPSTILVFFFKLFDLSTALHMSSIGNPTWETFLRIKYPKCGIHRIEIPWARKRSGFTLLMDALIVTMSQCMTISDVAKQICEHDTRIWKVVNHYVKEARSREDFSDVTVIGIDETSCAKGHKYVTLEVDFDTSKVIHVCEGKDSNTVSIFNYQNVQNFITMIYLRLGQLNFQLPT